VALTVDSKWLAANLDSPDIVILDARGQMDYRFGHVKNALSLGIEMVVTVAPNGANLVIEGAQAEKVFGSFGINDTKRVVVYGEQDDPAAARVAWSIMYHGHPDVALLDTGFSVWKHLGLPVTREMSQPKPAQFASKPRPEIRADAETIKARIADPSFVVIDARTPQEHMQARVPNSVLHDWEQGVGANGSAFLSPDELKKEFESKGITPDKEIVCYCHSGVRASHKYMQFRLAGYDKVKLYDGSIIDWAMRRNPIR
jgi:thiosulfate/3-mercaptopyruvate sulfurtransferase